MGYDRKYGIVTTEHGDIPADEPVIVFRARDRLTPELIDHYLSLAAAAGSPERHLDLVRGTAQTFRDWQAQNPGKVRTPDSERSREWLPE